MIKACFFDIDGTLLSFKTHRIPASALAALQALRGKGILLFVSTGRPYPDAAFLEDWFRFDGYITLNGQYCFNGKEVIYKKSIAREDLQIMAEQASRGDYICSFVNESGSFISGTDEAVTKLFEWVDVKVPPLRDPRTALTEEIYQAMVFLDRAHENILLDRTRYVQATRWHESFMDVIPAGGGKHTGIEALLKYYGLAARDCMGFGDGENDISMLEHLGTGVAMGNASEKVKRAAGYVTASVDDDGIAKALLHLGVLTEDDFPEDILRGGRFRSAGESAAETGPYPPETIREEKTAYLPQGVTAERESSGNNDLSGKDEKDDKSGEDRPPGTDCPEKEREQEGDWQERTRILLGNRGLEKLAGSSVAVIGIGGVGGYAAEMLCRCGVGRLILVDSDRVHPTNKNRQIIALDSTLGEFKIRVMERRLRDINPQIGLVLKNEYLEPQNVEEILSGEQIDYLVDAIDTLSPKIALIRYCVERKIPHVTSMGAGAKLDATAVRITDLSKSYNCPLAYVLRKKLRKEGISKGFPVAFSEELPRREAIIPMEERNKKSRTGTISYLPAVFGCACAQAAVEFLLGDCLIDK